MTRGGRPGILRPTVRRARLIGLAVALFVTSGVASAHACINVHLGGSGDPALGGPGNIVGPGGTVHFSISGLDNGAHWTVALVGTGQTRSGVGDGGPVDGVFNVPDLGASPQTLSLQGTATHEEVDGSFWPLGPITIEYRVIAPAPPPPPVTEPASPPATQAPAPARSRASAPRRTTDALGSARPSLSRSSATRIPPAAARTARPSARPARPSASTDARLPSPPRSALAHARPAAHPRASVTRQVHAVARSRRAAPRHLRPLPRLVLAPLTVAAAEKRRHGDWPWSTVLVATLLVATTVCAAVFGRRRRKRPGADRHEVDAIELELQELIAEARARQLGERSESRTTDLPA